jgi:two-component system, NtrC family, sensor kinase
MALAGPPQVGGGTGSPRRVGGVARRILLALGSVLLAFTVTLLWSLHTLRRSAEEAAVLRTGYVPLLLSLGTALETQDLVSAQLNHITEAKNPADARAWIETQRRVRPLSFAGVRSAADRGLRVREGRARAIGGEVVTGIGEIERYLDADGDRLEVLYRALSTGDRARATAKREELLAYEVEGARRLRELSRRVERAMDELTVDAVARERRATAVLIGMSAFSLAFGLALGLYTRRALRPLSRVTARAHAVAEGDLTPREAMAADDEIGELSQTFESMVAAIARARSELLQAERLAVAGKMAAQITHEIRNPISAMGLNAELLEEELLEIEGSDEARQLVGAIRREGERLAALSEQYLQLARRPRPELLLGDVGEVAAEVVAFQRGELSRQGIELSLHRDDDVPEVPFDEAQIRQALVNLVRNAGEAVASGGVIEIGVHKNEAGGVDVTVDDDGDGVPPSAAATLFEPFVTTKRHGTGLGLSVTREILLAHGGSIVWEPREPGTRFRISLPSLPVR